jgi:hypothetical protein
MKLSEIEPYRNIMVTYKKEVSSGPYGDTKTQMEVTKRGFYCSLFSSISIPPDWKHFSIGGKNVLLPHGWSGDRLQADQVIAWVYEESESTDE